VRDLPPHRRARGEQAKALDTEPPAEFPGVRKSVPNPRPMCAKQSLLRDAIGF